MLRAPRTTTLGLILAAAFSATLDRPASAQTPIGEADLAALAPRPIGPAVTGGRVHDIEALPSDPSTIFVATASGGLWKSTNRGHTWRNVFANQETSTFGDVAIAPSDAKVMYAGTGEQNNRQSTSWGHGVYRSDDAGETWRYGGLAGTHHIGKVEVDPRDPDVVFVAALGNLWRQSEERGVYRSRDGGRTWERVLHVDGFTGAVDLVMNPENPDIVYAATYQRLRRAWGFNGGGPGSGIYRSTDGGDTWTELTEGLPAGDKGRIGLAIAASEPRILNALVETADRETTGTYRSEDGGDTWERVSPLDPRPMYYSEIFIDPTDANRVYVLATSSFTSSDGGRTFEEIARRPTYDVGVHADHHALWIDPNDPEHFYLGGDAGVYETYDRGVRFRKVNNFPIGQFYAIGVDMRDPYFVYGGMQDNHSWMGPSQTRRWIGIVGDDWKQIGFGDGMFQQPNPANPRWVYSSSNGGNYSRVDTETGDIRSLRQVPPAGEPPYRWDWTSPSLVSRHDPSTVYLGGNRLFISHDDGESFTRTEDLTRAVDRDTLSLMGVRGADLSISANDGTSSYGEITTIAESPLDGSILWVGTDDGNVQLSRDGGATWAEVSGAIADVPDLTYVSRVAGSARGPGSAYVAFDAHRDGDFRPYLFRTDDFGRTWTALHEGLPEDGSVNVVVEHPDDPQTLFVGTEHGAYVSTDAGGHWARLPGLPTVLVDDMVVHPRDKDLVIGTHGASIWIVDDTRPLVEWGDAAAAGGAFLFSIDRATIFQHWKDTSYRGHAEFHGVNPPDGALITYRLGEGDGPATLTVRNAAGDVVRTMGVPSAAGVHRVNWDLRHDGPNGPRDWRPHADPELARPLDRAGPWVSPGVYTVALEARGTAVERTVEVRGDPELPLTDADYRSREAFMLGLIDLMERVREAAPDLRCPGGFGGGPLPEGRAGDLCRVMRGAQQLYGALSGGGVRPGTLSPPTADQRAAREELERTLARALAGG
ncbi:MAG: glycosyl hydrolase [Gemmatimonadetes bacterium]|nr:MAG: glycosyl hydrolase [Gemmatimonadota bacterium]